MRSLKKEKRPRMGFFHNGTQKELKGTDNKKRGVRREVG